MNTTYKTTLIILLALLIFSCSKKKTNNTSTYTVVNKVVGPHHWTGVEQTTTGYLFDTTVRHSTSIVSFDCPIDKINDTTILFEENAPFMREMSMQPFNSSSNMLTFYVHYAAPMNKYVGTSTITYNFLTDTLTLTVDEKYSTSGGYSISKLEAHSP